MSRSISFFNLSIKNILSDQYPIIDQARIRLVYYGLLLALLGVLFIIPNVYTLGQVLQTYIGVAVFFALLVLFKYFTYKPDFKLVSHALLIMATLLTLILVYEVFQNVNIIAVQVVILTILFGYYMLGVTWGTFYSLINSVIVLVYFVWADTTNMLSITRPEKLDGYTVIVSVFFNFILIMFIQGHFYNAFLKSIKQLKEFADSEKQLNEKLAKAIYKAEKSSEIQSDFLSTMSHEIRTPLNAVIGMGNLLMMEKPRPDQKENLEILRFSATNLLTLVNDVLDYNKIESGKIEFESIKFNLNELLHNICGGQIIKAEEKGLSFHLQVDEFLKTKNIIGDPTRLSQIIYNLVSNAIKFTQRGNVKVNVNCIEDRHNVATIKFCVIDSGIGIEQEKIQNIFEPFAQESITTTRQFGGTGIGLSIVKRLLELQGGTINVSSEMGVGSDFCFTMEFPVSTDTEVVAEPVKNIRLAEKGESPLGNIRVLIAEDNSVNVMLMKKLFSKWNITPVIAENGERAIELLHYGNFDIILMDLQMPVLDGYQAARAIRKMADPKKASIPIIALTASALFDIREKVFSVGMNDYVSKPFKPHELVEKMHNLLSPVINQ